MGFEGPSQTAPKPKVETPDESQRVEDIAKAQEMAEAGDRLRTEISGSPTAKAEGNVFAGGLRQQVEDANKSADELRNDPEKAEALRGHTDSLPVREYVADDLDKRLKGTEKAADRSEEIAGIIYELQNQDTLYNLSLEDVQRIKEIIEKTKK